MHTRKLFLVSLTPLLLLACGGAPHPTPSSADADADATVSTAGGAAGLPSGLAYLPPDTFGMGYWDVASIRQSPLAEHLERWLELVHGALPDAPKAQAYFNAGVTAWHETDGVLVGVAPPSGRHGSPQFVGVIRGRYAGGEVETWLRMLAEEERSLLVEARGQRQVLHSTRAARGPAGFVADAGTVVLSFSTSFERLLRIADGGESAHGRIDGLRAVAAEVGFGTHECDLVALPFSEIRGEFARERLLRGPNREDAHVVVDAVESVSAFISLRDGLDARGHVHTSTEISANAITRFAGAGISEMLREVGRTPWLRGVGEPLQLIQTRTEGTDAVASLRMDDAQTRAWLARLDDAVASIFLGSDTARPDIEVPPEPCCAEEPSPER
jgi:hypothetical protein